MSLSPDEASHVYERLARIAPSAGLGWLVRDVEHEIRLGRQTAKRLRPSDMHDAAGGTNMLPVKGKAATYVVATEYSETDKLRLLIEAIEGATVGLSLGVLECLTLISENLPNLQQIGFAPDEPETEGFLLSTDINKQREAVHRFKGLLDELKEAL